jgi:hypothetical protein
MAVRRRGNGSAARGTLASVSHTPSSPRPMRGASTRRRASEAIAGDPSCSDRPSRGRPPRGPPDHPHVCSVCPDHQVGRSNARRVVAGVTDFHALGHREVVEFPGVAVRQHEDDGAARGRRREPPISPSPRTAPQSSSRAGGRHVRPSASCHHCCHHSGGDSTLFHAHHPRSTHGGVGLENRKAQASGVRIPPAPPHESGHLRSGVRIAAITLCHHSGGRHARR